ncbi:hypothetical protein DFH29DRAFT_1023008 [Suillus ampliporus]|nr:hypothetical protein DFH29DRAFT_1023008 [Suillus ampliporus]
MSSASFRVPHLLLLPSRSWVARIIILSPDIGRILGGGSTHSETPDAHQIRRSLKIWNTVQDGAFARLMPTLLFPRGSLHAAGFTSAEENLDVDSNALMLVKEMVLKRVVEYLRSSPATLRSLVITIKARVQQPARDHVGTAGTFGRRRGHTQGAKAVLVQKRSILQTWFSFQPPLSFLAKGRRMTPAHAHFNLSFRNRVSHHSGHLLNRAEAQHSSVETIIPVSQDGLYSLDRPHITSIDEVNQGLKQSEEYEINCVDCTSSDSDRVSDEQASSMVSSFEVGNFAVGLPLHFMETHVARQHLVFSTSFAYETTIVSPEPQAVTPTTPTTTTSTTYSTLQSSTSCDTLVVGTSSCSVGSDISSLDSSIPTQSSSSCTGCLTLPSTNEGNVIYTTITTTSSVTFETLTTTTTSFHTTVVSNPLPQSTSAPDTSSNPQSHPNMAAIAGGVIGAVTLLALLILVAKWYRRKQLLSVTPFKLSESTIGPTRVEPKVWLRCRSTSGAVRSSIRGPSFAQYSDARLVEHSGNGYPSVVYPVSFHFPNDDDIFASSVVRRDQANELDELYRFPSRAHTSDHYSLCRVESWVEQMVMEDGSQEASEELPAYRSEKSLKSGEAKRSRS